jgi:hypothetical protein
MLAKHGERDSLQTEAETGSVRDPSVVELYSKCGPEVLLMIIKGRNSGSFGRGNRGQNFKLQTLRTLAVCK